MVPHYNHCFGASLSKHLPGDRQNHLVPDVFCPRGLIPEHGWKRPVIHFSAELLHQRTAMMLSFPEVDTAIWRVRTGTR